MKIGVMDSGSGGVSILAALTKDFPGSEFVYIGDSVAFPYSLKTPAELEKRAEHLTEQLLLHGCQLLVVACNTLTVTTIAHLRAQFPDVPFVGTVPAVAEAARVLPAQSNVLILATAATAQSKYLQALLQPYATQLQWNIVGTTELVTAVESGDTQEQTAIVQAIKSELTSLPEGIVIGCTHFSAAQDVLSSIFGAQVQFFEPQAGICKQVAKLGKLVQSQTGSVLKPRITWLDTGSRAQHYAAAYEQLKAQSTSSEI